MPPFFVSPDSTRANLQGPKLFEARFIWGLDGVRDGADVDACGA